METRTVLLETWLSRRPRRGSLDLTLGLLALCVLATFVYLNGAGGLEKLLAASGDTVLRHHEWWRAWTTLFVHADLGHLGGNALLFVPLSYFLAGYFPRWFFPGLAMLEGGVLNFVVLATMDPRVTLVGISGVVFWMGAAWLTLYLCLEKRDRPVRRAGKVILVTAALFVPDTVRPEISYLSHYLGFLAGALSGLLLYRVRRTQFRAADRWAELPVFDQVGDAWMEPPLEESP